MDIELYLDSGAFSAWSQQTSVDIIEYAEYLKNNCEWYDYAVNLDKIPGEFGRIPTSTEVEQSAQEGFDNYIFLRDEYGIDSKPVFHQGEQFKWLDRMIAEGCQYIGISPANDRTTKQKVQWLDQVFSHIVDSDGYPIVKTHGFGVTSIPVLWRYPWYSADSTSWVLFGAYGMVLVPQWDETGFRYDLGPNSVFISSKSKAITIEGKHFNSYPKEAQDRIVEYMERAGIDLQSARDNHTSRSQVNAFFFKDVAANNPLKPFHRKNCGFFQPPRNDSKSLGGKWERMKVIFATSDNSKYNQVLNNLKIEERLVSYYYVKNSPDDFMEKFSKYGIYPRTPKKKKGA